MEACRLQTAKKGAPHRGAVGAVAKTFGILLVILGVAGLAVSVAAGVAAGQDGDRNARRGLFEDQDRAQADAAIVSASLAGGAVSLVLVVVGIVLIALRSPGPGQQQQQQATIYVSHPGAVGVPHAASDATAPAFAPVLPEAQVPVGPVAPTFPPPSLRTRAASASKPFAILLVIAALAGVAVIATFAGFGQPTAALPNPDGGPAPGTLLDARSDADTYRGASGPFVAADPLAANQHTYAIPAGAQHLQGWLNWTAQAGGAQSMRVTVTLGDHTFVDQGARPLGYTLDGPFGASRLVVQVDSPDTGLVLQQDYRLDFLATA